MIGLIITLTVIGFGIAIVFSVIDKMHDFMVSTKYSNFVKLDNNYATIDIVEGWLFYKKRLTSVKVKKEFSSWRRCDTGANTLGFEVEDLAFAYSQKDV